jgi:hypothetical protein
MPPTVQVVLDPAQFQSSASMTEGAGGEPVDVGAQIGAAAMAAFRGNADALARLLSSPDTLPEVKAVKAATNGTDPASPGPCQQRDRCC